MSEEYNELMSAQEAAQISGTKFRGILKKINDDIHFSANAGGYEAEIMSSDISLDIFPELIEIFKSKGYAVEKFSADYGEVHYLKISWSHVNE